MLNTINRLMEMDATELTPKEIDDLIEYYRKQRAQVELGVKPKKGTTAGGEAPVTLDLEKLGLIEAPKETFKRRI